MVAELLKPTTTQRRSHGRLPLVAGRGTRLLTLCRFVRRTTLSAPVLNLVLNCILWGLPAEIVSAQTSDFRVQSTETVGIDPPATETLATRIARCESSATPITAPSSRPLLIAFSSLRDRPAFASLHLYRHDAVDRGELVAALPQLPERGDTHPSLTIDGQWCLYTSKQVGGFGPQVQLFDVRKRELVAGPRFNEQFAARTEVTLSGDGRWIALCVWDQPGQAGGWDVLLYDRENSELVELPGLNSAENEREVSLSAAGRYVAFTSDRSRNAGLSDVFVYDREARALLDLPGVNTPARELNPSLSADGRWLAFVSDRHGGAGGKDILVYDCQTGELARPEGVNSVAHEQTPVFSPDGGILAFVSERIRGAGERDIYLYDRRRQQLLPTPGLNSTAEDFDPWLAWFPE